MRMFQKKVILFFLSQVVAIFSAQAIDPLATKETKALYNNLKKYSSEKLLFGQQFATYSGQNFNDNQGANDSSDCLTAIGSNPAMIGLNFCKITSDIKSQAISFYNKNGVVTVHWPMDNPVTGGTNNDLTKAVYRIIPGGDLHSFYVSELNRLGAFFKSLISDTGELVPILFRPFHENTGSFFWWGASQCTPEEYITLYQFTVSYLRDSLGVHNVLYVYAPSRPTDYPPYSQRYPGDDYVDVIAFDRYDTADGKYTQDFLSDCKIVVAFAQARNKVAAVSETGVKKGVQSSTTANWFMSQLLTPLKNDPVARKVAYMLTWANTNPSSYWVPLQGQFTYKSFVDFYNDPYTVFRNDIPNMYEDTAAGINFPTVNSKELKIYPNPTTDFINVPVEESVRIEIIDLKGEKLLETNKTRIDIRHLLAGIYFVKISGANFNVVKSFERQ